MPPHLKCMQNTPGKLTVNSLFEVKDRDALSTAYTPRRCGALSPDQGEPGRCV